MEHKPSHCAGIAAAVLFAAALLAVAASVGIAVIKVLVPRTSATIGLTTIRKYPTWEYVVKNTATVEGELMHGLITALGYDRERVNTKATWLRRAYISLLVGISGLLLFGVILAIDAL